MAYLTTRLDAWITHRLGGTAVLALLPGGTATGLDSIFNNTRPQAAAAYPLFVAFHQAGAVVTNCLPYAKHGVTAQYVMQVYQPGGAISTLAPLLDAMEAQFIDPASGQYVTEEYNGYRFTVLSQDAEPQDVNVADGVLYSTAGYRWLIAAEAA
jgi:hypothetical protein